MSKKLVLAAVITFLSMAIGVAFYSDGSLAGTRPYYLGNVVIYSIFAYPLSAAIVLWEHRSSRALKYFSAGIGLIVTLILIWRIGPVVAVSPDVKMTGAVIDRLVVILSCFVFSSTLVSIAWRLLIRLISLLSYLTSKLKHLSRPLPT
jgi:hypothetical protein